MATTLFPRGYGGFPSYQFSSPDQFNTQHYNNRYPRRGPSFAPHYPTKPLYQPPFNVTDRYTAPVINQFPQPGLTTQLINLFNELDAQYRYEGYLRQLEKMRKQYWKQQAQNIPLTIYPATLPLPPPPPLPSPLPPPMTYDPRTIFRYEKETQYVPYPIYIGPGGRGFGGGGNFGSNYGYGTGGGMGLPPKIRVIFIPTGQSFLQQPYTGSLAMPPFLYNRISQPLCSFPLPPPLPQIGSLPLTPAVQQMVMQRYSNPVAVLPFTPNWQMPQLPMSGYPLASQQQQQSILPASAFQSFPPAPQAYIPPPAPQIYIPPPAPPYPPAPQAYIPAPAPPYPPAPQAYIPPPPPVCAPISAFQSLPPAPQAYIPGPVPPPAPTSAISLFPSAPQAYNPPPPVMPDNLPVLSPPSLQLPVPNANAVPSSSQYSYSGYPSMCRACPPAPPPLNITVTGHCWVQHCCACHQVSTSICNPNVRPNGGRITPLLRHPTVPQYVPEQINQQQYLHANAPVMMRPWLRKTPPLPPGAVVVSDEYLDRDGYYSRYGPSQRQHRHHKRDSHAKRRSATVTSKATSGASRTDTKNTRSVSPEKRQKSNTHRTQQKEPVKSGRTTPMSSSSTTTSGLSAEYKKTTMLPPNTKQDTVPQQFTHGSRNINLQYKYQPQELPNVYLLNRYLKSNSETSTLSSNVEAQSDNSSLFVKERNPLLSPSNDSISTKKESNIDKDDESLLRPPSQPKPKERLIIIREFRSNSPSTMSTVSSDIAFSIIDNDEDPTSATSTIKPNKLEEDEDDLLRRYVF